MYPDSPRITAITTISLGFLLILQLLSLSRPTMQANLPQTPPRDYWAGVVEFKPSLVDDKQDRLADNLAAYLEILNGTVGQNLDIIVFPESTLNNDVEMTFVPDPAINHTAPCDQVDDRNSPYHEFLRRISCAASQAKTYVVINVKEKENCTTTTRVSCASNGLNIYNTNVVFDRSGRVISRYRKVHPFREHINTTKVPEFGEFDTDFGVRFGQFICFDIIFYTPAQEMVTKHHIKDFVFPSMWFSQLPFLTSVQNQFAWSYANDVNLLSAGASNPNHGSTGTGIYNGRNGIISARMTLFGDGERRLYTGLVSKQGVKKKTNQPSPQIKLETTPRNIKLLRDRVQNYQSEEIDLFAANTTLDRKLCSRQGSFCCDFHLEWDLPADDNNNYDDKSYYHYRMAVFEGLRDDALDIHHNYIKNCAVFACTGSSIDTCGRIFSATRKDSDFVNWRMITIGAVYPKTKQFLLMPNSLTERQLMPLNPEDFSWRLNTFGDNIEARLSLKSSVDDLLTFAIYGNYYDSSDASWPLQGSLLLTCLVVILHVIKI